MVYIDPATNKPEIRSSTTGSWSRINEIGGYSKKKLKLHPGVNKVIRDPGFARPMSSSTLARKQATAERIARIQRANQIYRVMVENPQAKRDVKTGGVVVQLREKGRFLPKQVLL